MYESINFEMLMNRMLGKIPLGMDKTEGSIIYDALAPCAAELAVMYIELDVILKETFGDTASREYLIRRAKERGLSPYEASSSIMKGEFDLEIPIGSRFTCGELVYFATEKFDKTGLLLNLDSTETILYYYKMECETVGTEGNKNFGKLIPIDYIQDLKIANLIELLIPAEDDEDTESFRARYFESFDYKAYGGNIKDYLDKTNSISGVGATKVTPVWNGGGTVKLTILDSEFNKASDTLIDEVQEIIDPTGDHTGVGVAPIGHVVTVVTVNEIAIDVSCKITLEFGKNASNYLETVRDIIIEYLAELRSSWADNDSIIIRIAEIEARIMNISSVIDINSTRINSSSSNLTLNADEVPIVGGVSID